jgi:hypothetical protein
MTDLPGRMIAVGRAVGDGGRSGGALVAVMKLADLGDCDDTPGWDRLYLAPAWAVATETLVRPRNVVVAEVRAKQATRVAFVEHDDEIEAFAANRADDALGEGILPGSARCNDDLANAHAFDPALEVGAVDGIAIGEQVSGAFQRQETPVPIDSSCARSSSHPRSRIRSMALRQSSCSKPQVGVPDAPIVTFWSDSCVRF